MNILKSINLKGLGEKHSGKVRDFYIIKSLPAGRQDLRILITTDRISAFDRILGFIPHKGQVLNELSAFWFEHTKDIIDNHLIAIPDPNVTIAKNATPIPIEMVVRGYITGVTGTSIWGSYEKGERTIYGLTFPQGLRKNQKLPQPIITPTTKADLGHDERLTRTEILKQKIVSEDIYKQMEKAALAIFKRGSEICEKNGIILVDTKYEFGIYNNELLLIDEIHTPDSSRFWIEKTYKQRFEKGEEPENFDKEFLRLWYKNHGYSGDGKPPKMPTSFVVQVSRRYRDVYEKITGKKFIMSKQSIATRIKKNLEKYTKIMNQLRIAVLVSNKGTGTNLQAIIDAIEAKKINATIAVVISDEKDAYGLTRAKKHHLQTALCRNQKDLLSILKKYDVDLVALGGWKQIIPNDVLKTYTNKILNIHPGLIPDQKNTIIKNPDGTPALWNKGKLTEIAIKNFFDTKATYAGSSVHFLTDDFDNGPVLARTFEKILPNDTVESLYKRLKQKENKIYVQVIQKLSQKSMQL